MPAQARVPRIVIRVPAAAFVSPGSLHADVCRFLRDMARTLSPEDRVVVFIPSAGSKKTSTGADAAVCQTLMEAGIPADRITVARNHETRSAPWFAQADSQPGRVVIEIDERPAAA